MAELLLGAVILLAVAAFVADRYGQGGVEVLAFLALLALDLAMMVGLFSFAVAENCDDGWECSRPVGIGLALGVAVTTFGLVALLARARD